MDTSMKSILVVDTDIPTAVMLCRALSHSALGGMMFVPLDSLDAVGTLMRTGAGHVDAVMVDTSQHWKQSIARCRLLRMQQPTVPIAAFSVFPMQAYAARLAHAGVQGLVHSADIAVLADAARNIADGGVWPLWSMPDLALDTCWQAYVRLSLQSRANIDDRMRRAMTALAANDTVRGTARCLSVEYSTMCVYVRRVYRQLAEDGDAPKVCAWLERVMDAEEIAR